MKFFYNEAAKTCIGKTIKDASFEIIEDDYVQQLEIVFTDDSRLTVTKDVRDDDRDFEILYKNS